MDLTDEQWEIVSPLIREPKRREDGRGRPWRDPRDVLHGILWVLRTGAPWKDLPERYPPYQTCHRRFQQWSRDGTLRGVLEVLAEDLYRRGRIDLREAFVDGTFAGAKKGGSASAKPSAGRGPRSGPFQTALVFLSPPGLQVLRPLRRYRRRWKIERLFAWLFNFRRLVTRCERHAENFLGFLHLGCICILLRHF